MTGYVTFRRLLFPALLLIAGALAPVSGIRAQVSDVLMDVDRSGGYVGLGGVVRKGMWTPLRVTLANRSAELRSVRLMWLMEDNDGDRVVYQRRVTIDALRDSVQVWLYGTPPMSMRPQEPWTLVMVDDQTDRVLSSMQVYAQYDNPDRVLPLEKSAIGIMGSVELGLRDYTNLATEHEPLTLVGGLTLATLPDRWYGLSVLDSLIWTWRDGEGGDPNDPAFTPESQEALRQWVRRGGHMVIVMPAIDDPWTGSPMEDLLPVTRERMRTVTDLPPVSLGASIGAERAPITMRVFDVEAGDGVEVIDTDRAGNAFVVAKRYGFGRVTLIGADLAHPNLIRAGYPNGPLRVWNKVFRWTYPAITDTQLLAGVRNAEISRPETRGAVVLGDTWVGRTITMTNTAAPVLLGSIVVFVLYWLAAGPLAFGVLKTKGALRHSWLIFTVVVAGFTLVTWAAAMLVRQGHVSVAHFSVLDIDGRTGEAHAHGWATVFVPTFGDIDVDLDPGDNEQSQQTLASPGLFDQVQGARFPDPRSYSVNAAAPDQLAVPMRATSKQFVYDFHGRLDHKQKGLTAEWLGPEGAVTIENFLPKGELTHHLPQPIEDMLVVFCPGDNQRPWVWRHRDPWEPGKPLTIEAPPQRVQLTIDARGDFPKQRSWPSEGYLGMLVGLKTGGLPQNATVQFPGSTGQRDVMQQIEMLSFFSALPPPNYRDTDFSLGRETSYRRQFGKALDMTELTSGRRLILIGHLRNSPLPAPLTVDGQAIEQVNSSSWTVMRWVYDLQ